MTLRPRAKSRPSEHQPDSMWRAYVEDVQRPLYCLLFLFPLVATYEFGALLLRPVSYPGRQLVAHSLIQDLLGWFGATGTMLPAVVLLATLLVWHMLTKESWRVRGWVLPLMACESVILIVPLFVLGQLLQASGSAASNFADVRQQMVLALGAGVYEELVFRLYLMSAVLWLFENGLRIRNGAAAQCTAVVLSAGIFAASHFQPIGIESFHLAHFVQLTAAGAYLAVVFLLRGLGITAGCHAAFNLALVLSAAPL
jgi:hypothetical protein